MFVVGIVVGIVIGAVAVSSCVVAGESDERMENYFRENNGGKQL